MGMITINEAKKRLLARPTDGLKRVDSEGNILPINIDIANEGDGGICFQMRGRCDVNHLSEYPQSEGVEELSF